MDRVKRWAVGGIPDPSLSDAYKVMHVLFTYDKVPPCVSFAYIQSICYGWMTDERFKTYPVRSCVFCDESGGKDSFYHYANCDVLWKVCRKLGLGEKPALHLQLPTFLLLEGAGNLELRMTFLYACMVSVHKLRGPHHYISKGSRERYITANFKDVVSRSKNLQTFNNQLWASRV